MQATNVSFLINQDVYNSVASVETIERLQQPPYVKCVNLNNASNNTLFLFRTTYSSKRKRRTTSASSN